MEMYEFYNLGFDEVMPFVRARHGTGDLLDAVCAHLDFSETVVEEDRIPVAIIGRPNVGKSSLTNRILGENRMIVANEAGTTRDAIDTPVDNAYGKFIFTDTAGLRKRSNITAGLERYMVVRALAAVERSRVALILVDATVGFTEQDSKVAGYAHDQARRASSSSTSGTRWKARRPTPWSCSAAIMPSASALWAMLLSSSSRLRPATT